MQSKTFIGKRSKSVIMEYQNWKAVSLDSDTDWFEEITQTC